MPKPQQGFTLIELMGALAIGALMVIGLSAMIDRSLDDSKGQQAALHQAQVSAAALKYISQNYTALAGAGGATADSPQAVPVSALVTLGLLPASFNASNAYGQTPCLLVLQSQPNRLDALLVTEGGTPIPDKDIAYIAGNAGQGGGYITSDAPAQARGAFGSWSLGASRVQALSTYLSKSCSGTIAARGHLATAIFYDGPGQLSTDFVYRNTVANHPELNQMTTALGMRKVVREDSSDALCSSADASSNGRIAVDAGGVVLSCQSGIWRRHGAGSWKEPVATFADLPPATAGNQLGDVRMVTALHLAFIWDNGAWCPLAVDQDGNLNVPGNMKAQTVQITQVVNAGTRCEQNGVMAIDASGMGISCQSGIWRKFAESKIITPAVWTFGFKQTPSSGSYEQTFDLTTLSGSRPLFISGANRCKSYDVNEASAFIEYLDANGVSLGYAGGCVSLSNNVTGFAPAPDYGQHYCKSDAYPTDDCIPKRQNIRVMAGNYMALQKIPENAKYLHINMQSKGINGNYSQLSAYVFNSI